NEPAADLGVVIAAASSYLERPVPPDVLLLGEVGLTGEVRAVNGIEPRLRAAAQLGFKSAIVPKSNVEGALPLAVKGVATVSDAPFAGGRAAPLLLVYAFAPMLGAWVGAAVGVRRAVELPGFAPRAGRTAERVLDTSVIIDGRVADLAEAGFLDGALVVPQFVVRELQR